MRATILTSCAVLALAWPLVLQSRSCLAQGAGADKPTAAPAAAGTPEPTPGVASPGRVGSLSPDEERRAARGRERAAAAAKATQGRVNPAHADGRGMEAAHPAPAARHDVVPARRSAVRNDDRSPASRKLRQAKGRIIRSARIEPTAPRRADGPVRRRRLADGLGRDPRIGDVIPADVPLTPLPPGVPPSLIQDGRFVAATEPPRGPLFFRPYLPVYVPYPVYPYPARVLLIP